MKLWRIATDAPDYKSDDLKGVGARMTGGRWNRPGTSMLYCSTNIALAVLETLTRIKAGDFPLNRYLIEIDVPEDIWNKAKKMHAPAVGWDAIPTAAVSLDIGESWVKANTDALMIVPSVIVPEEFNVLVNPMHPDALRLKARKVRKWIYDLRLIH